MVHVLYKCVGLMMFPLKYVGKLIGIFWLFLVHEPELFLYNYFHISNLVVPDPQLIT